MANYNLKSAISKIGRVIGSGRGMDYFKRAKSLFSDLKNDYSNPDMGRKRRKRSTPKMGKKKGGKRRK